MASGHIFISHSSRDRAFVARLERTLTSWGLQPWVDQQQLAGGQRWSEALAQAIHGSAAVVVVISPAALASLVVRQEYQLALQLGKPVILLRLESVAHLPPELAQLPLCDGVKLKWRGEHAVFQQLYDNGVVGDEQGLGLESSGMGVVMRGAVDRMAGDWRRYTADRRRDSWLGILNSFGVVGTLGAIGALFRFQYSGQAASPLSILGVLRVAGIFGWFGLALAVLALFFILLLRAEFAIAYALRRLPPEMIVVTPDRFAVRAFRLRWARSAIEALQYPYSEIAAITQRRMLFGGVRLTLRDRATNAAYTVLLPWRFVESRAIATTIMRDWRQYQAHLATATILPHTTPNAPVADSGSFATANAGHVESAQSAQTAMPPNEPVWFTVIASQRDTPLLEAIRPQLAWRNLHLASTAQLTDGSGLVVPTADAITSLRFALCFATPVVTQSPYAQRIIADLLARNILVIPLRVDPATPLPPLLAQLQWVDWNPQIEERRRLQDLLNALDSLGISVELPGIELDSELALARAWHQRLPSGWEAFRPIAPPRTLYTSTRLIGRIAPWILGPVLFVIVLAPLFAAIPLTTTGDIAILGSLGLLLVFALLMSLLIFRYLRRRLNAELFQQLIDERITPEVVVLAPTGIVAHAVDLRTRQMLDITLLFNQVRAIKTVPSYFTATRLHCDMYHGPPVEFNLSAAFEQAAILPAKIITHLKEYQTRQGR